ncbi:hypothetical protein ACQJBY_009578 [Aegilops geniculata]
MSLVAACAAGVRASLLSSSASSCSRPCPALARHGRAYRSLVSPAASRGGRCSSRLRVRAARLEPTGVSVGFRAPQFELPEPLTGKIWMLDDFEGSSALLVMFICNHCPFVKHLKKDIAELTSFYMEKGLASVAISSNSIVTHRQDGPEYMAEEAKLLKYPFPYPIVRVQTKMKPPCVVGLWTVRSSSRARHGRRISGWTDTGHPIEPALDPRRPISSATQICATTCNSRAPQWAFWSFHILGQDRFDC